MNKRLQRFLGREVVIFSKIFKKVEGVVLQPQEDESVSGYLEINDLELFYYIKKNDDKSANNEDALYIYHNGDDIVFGTCDGAGGYPDGDKASKLICEKACEFLTDSNVDTLDKIDEINTELKKKVKKGKSTFTLCRYHEGSFKFSSIGDSEVSIFSEEHTLYQSISHSPIGFQVQAGMLDEEEALLEPGRNIVSFLMGDEVYHVDSSSKLKFDKSMISVCGSDGLFDNFTFSEIEDLLLEDFKEGCEQLKEACDKQENQDTWYKDDDISFIIARKK